MSDLQAWIDRIEQDDSPVQHAINIIAAARVVNLVAIPFNGDAEYNLVPTKAIMQLRTALVDYMAITKQGAFAEEQGDRDE